MTGLQPIGDQVDALHALSTRLDDDHHEPMVLAGPAGSGKTTMMRIFAEEARNKGWRPVWLSSTGKAAARLAQVTGEPASTVHGAIYSEVWNAQDDTPRFGGVRELEGGKSLVVVDESSMVDEALHDDLVRFVRGRGKLLFVGDPFQLPPVAGRFGPALEPIGDRGPTYTLKTVIRQALDSPILRIATELREEGKPVPHGRIGDAWYRRAGTLKEASRWMAAYKDRDCCLITWTNKTRQLLNRGVRLDSGLASQGEISVGDKLRVRSNNRDLGLMNGHLVTVEKVTLLTLAEYLENTSRSTAGIPEELLEQVLFGIVWRHERRRGKALVKMQLAESNRGAFMRWLRVTGVPRYVGLHATHGFCLTAHASQGSEWAHVGCVIDRGFRIAASKDPQFSRRLIYTMITRSKRRVSIWDC